MSEEWAVRKTAIHLLRSGKTVAEVAREVNRSVAWVYKWRKRYFATGDWQELEDRSRAPKHPPGKLSATVRQAIRVTRSELEAEADEPGKLSYIGAHSVYGRLKQKGVTPLPSISSIERELRVAGMTRLRKSPGPDAVSYPHVHPVQPHQLVQVDIVPRYLPGGPCVSCFNAIDVVSRYPSGRQSLTRRSSDAVNFLIHVWSELGIPTYTQVDNEGCFSGGFTHPGVLGKVLRLALMVGTELVFSPIRHPASNGSIERFHQDYTGNVWDKITLPDLAAVQQHSANFFDAYRHSPHHSALQGLSPQQIQMLGFVRKLPPGFRPPAKPPLTVGQVHFIRAVDRDRRVMILNQNWEAPSAKPQQGVWVTLQFGLRGAKLRIYDAAPDARPRTCLAEHPFPLKEPVRPLEPHFEQDQQRPRPSWTRSVAGWIGRGVGQLLSTMF